MELLYITLYALIVDSIINLVLLKSGRGGYSIREWYKTFKSSALIMDVTSIVIATWLAIKLGKGVKQRAIILLCVQLVHDISIGVYLKYNTFEKGTVFELWKRYSEELGTTVLMVDAFMLLLTYGMTFNKYHQAIETETVLYSNIVMLYILTLLVNSF